VGGAAHRTLRAKSREAFSDDESDGEEGFGGAAHQGVLGRTPANSDAPTRETQQTAGTATDGGVGSDAGDSDGNEDAFFDSKDKEQEQDTAERARTQSELELDELDAAEGQDEFGGSLPEIARHGGRICKSKATYGTQPSPLCLTVSGAGGNQLMKEFKDAEARQAEYYNGM
jgi:hypothetical protein